jgi:hypothetical protein
MLCLLCFDPTLSTDCQGPAVHSGCDLWAVRWYLMFPISYRELELMLRDRGTAVDHTTIFHWIQKLCGVHGEGMGPIGAKLSILANNVAFQPNL